MKESDFLDLMDDKGVLVDVKGLYRKHIKSLTYWSL
jgi:hypothetical protein